jgi:hypothetical protein
MALFTGDWALGNLELKINDLTSFVFANLEGPISEFDLIDELSYQKVGPKLKSSNIPPRLIGLANLANNHIMDYGENGLRQTMMKLDRLGIPSVGTGKDVLHSRRHKEVLVDGHRVIVIACAERQFGESRPDRPGFAAFGPWVFSAINELRESGAFIVVSFHGGIENSPVPSPDTQELFRSFVTLGASIVWAHHTHIPQGWEFYKSGLILYGLGNFATDPKLISHEGMGKYSIAAEVDFHNLEKTKFYATKQDLTNGFLEINFEEFSRSEIVSHINDSNRLIADPALLAQKWIEVSKMNYNGFYREVFAHEITLRRVIKDIVFRILSKVKNRKLEINPYIRSRKLLALHVISTESHVTSIRDFLSHHERGIECVGENCICKTLN